MDDNRPVQTQAHHIIKPRTATSKTAEYLPLTTIFTAPASCLDSRLFGIERKPTPPTGFRDFSALDTECWPPYYGNLELPPVIGTSLWYSPGVCPESHTIAHSALLQPQEGSEQVTTQAWCCPRGMAYTKAQKNSYEYCSSNVVTPTAIHHNGTTTTKSNFYAFMWPISVQWASSDLSLFTPRSAPLLARVPASTTQPESSPTPAAGQTSSGDSNSPNSSGSGGGGGLSTGAQAGIGVGVGIAGAVLLALAVWLLMRRRRRDRSQPGISSNREQSAKAAAPTAVQEMGDNRGSPPELGGGDRSARWELGNSPRDVAELGGKQASSPTELDGRRVHEM